MELKRIKTMKKVTLNIYLFSMQNTDTGCLFLVKDGAWELGDMMLKIGETQRPIANTTSSTSGTQVREHLP